MTASSGAMLAEIVSRKVATAEAVGHSELSDLFPDERIAIAGAVEARRRDFTVGRSCARGALITLGVGPVPIPCGERGAPTWPNGVVGSITHCEGYCAAAVAWTKDLAGIGIDAEPADALPADVLPHIALSQERLELARLMTLDPATNWDRLLFSAKEAVYKAWFPIAHRWLDFTDACVTFDPSRNSFEARLLVPPLPLGEQRQPKFIGRWLVRNDLILTAVMIGALSAR